jgi:hypothetical protein
MDVGQILPTRFAAGLSSRPSQVNSNKLRHNSNTRGSLIGQSLNVTTKTIARCSSRKRRNTNYKLK